MICSACKLQSPNASGLWTPEKTAELRALGWFLWDRQTLLRFYGLVLCPKCLATPCGQLLAELAAP